MKIIILTLSICISLFSQTLSFGAISTVNNSIMEKKLTPLIDYISKTVSKDLKFKTSFDYADTIEQFKNSNYDLGFIGPSPFVIATHKQKNRLKIIAGLNNAKNGYFHSVIIVKKDSKINKLSDLKNRSFAFGSPKSTLSYFMPMYMLKKENIDKELSKYVFLGKHDKVAKNVIMGKYDAGGLKASVAKKYAKYIKVIKKSQDVPDFIVVASSKFPDSLVKKIRQALLKPEAVKIAQSIKPSATGFRLRKYSDYSKLKSIMLSVDPNSLK